jgi:hypothetical protein
MRVTSGLWVAAYVRRCNAEGAFAVVARRGAEEAGAIFVIVDRLDGTVDLYGPAPQTAFTEGVPETRLFQSLTSGTTAAAATERLDKETRFDPDLWVVAVEDRAGRAFLDLVAP